MAAPTAAASGAAGKGAVLQTAIGTEDDATRGMPYHDKLTADLKQAILKKRILERNIVGLFFGRCLVFLLLSREGRRGQGVD